MRPKKESITTKEWKITNVTPCHSRDANETGRRQMNHIFDQDSDGMSTILS